MVVRRKRCFCKFRIQRVRLTISNGEHFKGGLTEQDSNMKLWRKIAWRGFAIFLAFEIVLACIYLILLMTGATQSYAMACFDLNGEMNVPAIYSALQLVAVGGVFVAIAWMHQTGEAGWRIFLATLGLFFLFFAADESFEIHEMLGGFMKANAPFTKLWGDSLGWVTPYAIAGIIWLAATFRYYLRMIRKYPYEFAVLAGGFAIYAFGAVGMEIIGSDLERGEDAVSLVYGLQIVFEELTEMVGVSVLFLGAALLGKASATRVRAT